MPSPLQRWPGTRRAIGEPPQQKKMGSRAHYINQQACAYAPNLALKRLPDKGTKTRHPPVPASGTQPQETSGERRNLLAEAADYRG
jgi:hypothetical protein